MAAGVDIAIIGGGIAGVSLAAAIGGRASVVVLEAEPLLFSQTSSRSAQQIQPSYGPAQVRAITRASMPIVERISASILTPRPLIWVGLAGLPDAVPGLLATNEALRAIDAAEAVRMFPALRPGVVASAAVDDEAMEVDVDALLSHYAEVAREAGARLVSGARVVSATRRDGAWHLDIGGETVVATTVVNAAGPWADDTAELLGARRRGLVPTRRTVVVAAPRGRQLDPNWPMIADAGMQFYLRPRGGLLLASSLEDIVSVAEDARPEPATVAETLRRVNAATDLDLGDPAESWTGLRTLSGDELPVVGRDDEVDGLYWLAGQGGYGIQTSAALSRLAAADLLGVEAGLGAEADAAFADLGPGRDSISWPPRR
jgi:D-arginine dehydrogenase